MASPLPSWPRGKRRPHRPPAELLLGCPRISPEFELCTVQALMKPKPHTRGVVQHRDGLQPWTKTADAQVDGVLARLDAVGSGLTLHREAAGEFHLLGCLRADQLEEAKAIGVALSSVVPDCWFVLGRLFLRDGRFYRRRFGYQLRLTLAKDVHLTRPMRALVRQAMATPEPTHAKPFAATTPREDAPPRRNRRPHPAGPPGRRRVETA